MNNKKLFSINEEIMDVLSFEPERIKKCLDNPLWIDEGSYNEEPILFDDEKEKIYD